MTDADPAVPALPTIDPDRETQLTELEGKLDVRLRDRRLLNLALQHGSYGHGGAAAARATSAWNCSATRS